MAKTLSAAKLLAFDTSQGALSVALFEGDVAIARHFETLAKGHAESMLPRIETVMGEAGLLAGDLDILAVTVGPGTFTGIRAGLAAARGIALAKGIPIVGVTSLRALAEEVAVPGDAEPLVLAILDARRGEAYWQCFGPGGTGPGGTAAPRLDPLDDIADAVSAITGAADRLVLVGTGASLLAPLLAVRGIQAGIAEAAQPNAVGVGRAALAAIKAAGIEPFRTPPRPLYIRAPDAKLPGGLALPAML